MGCTTMGCTTTGKKRRLKDTCQSQSVAAAASVVIFFTLLLFRTSSDGHSHNLSNKRLSRLTRSLSAATSSASNQATASVKKGSSDFDYSVVGYHKRDIPARHSNSTVTLSGSNAPLAGPISYWKASRQNNNNQDNMSATTAASTIYLETTDLSDVFFYLALAVTWLVWLLKSFVKSDWLRYTQNSQLVRGHVLQVTKDEVDEMGIPTYKAVVDYFVGEDDDNQIQIRKEFTTGQTQLEEGFGKVELLVLSDEPTSSVLKEDWQNTLNEMEENQLLWRNNASFSTAWLMSTNLWKRVWVVFLACLVLASLAGSMVAARFLPPHTRPLGWWIVFISFVCLLPVALVLRMALTSLERFFQGNGGIIMSQKKNLHHHSNSGNLLSVIAGATVNNPTISNGGTLGAGGDDSGGALGGNNSNNTSTATPANATNGNNPCDPFAMLDTNACDETEAFSLAHTRQIEMSATHHAVDETAGCYVIRMPTVNAMTASRHRVDGSGRNRSDISNGDVSDVSSVSLKDHHHDPRRAGGGYSSSSSNQNVGGSQDGLWNHESPRST